MDRSRWIAAALLTGTWSVAVACGPDFPWQLLSDRAATLRNAPANSFSFEAARLTTSSDSLKANESEDSRKAAVDIGSFADPQAEALYRAAVSAISSGANEDAAERFNQYLGLPAAAIRDHDMAALYNLGKIQSEGSDLDTTAATFQQVRRLALDGRPDALGLAVASYGEEARLYFNRAKDFLKDGTLTSDDAKAYADDIASAVELYSAQAARNSLSGNASLRFVAGHLVESQDLINAVIARPLVRKLLLVYAIQRTDLNNETAWLNDDQAGMPGAPTESALTMVASAIAAQGLQQTEAVDQLAALAYRTARYDLAKDLVLGSTTALSLWVQAKLAIQDGAFEEAAHLYARAIATSSQSLNIEPDNEKRLHGEFAVLQLRRQDYASALETLWPFPAKFWGDIVYVAERVLTLDELKGFVDTHPRANMSGSTVPHFNAANSLRALLARRLMREHRFDDAAAYFDDPEIRARAASFGREFRLGQSKELPVTRSQALWRAALEARDHGISFLGYEGPPDNASVGGSYRSAFGQDSPGATDVSEGERIRFEHASGPYAKHRYHYRAVAADLAKEAADLAPPRSQAFAALLCQGSGWMLKTQGSEDKGRDLYRLYVRKGAHVPWAADFGANCPNPDFDSSFRVPGWVAYINEHLPGRVRRWLK